MDIRHCWCRFYHPTRVMVGSLRHLSLFGLPNSRQIGRHFSRRKFFDKTMRLASGAYAPFRCTRYLRGSPSRVPSRLWGEVRVAHIRHGAAGDQVPIPNLNTRPRQRWTVSRSVSRGGPLEYTIPIEPHMSLPPPSFPSLPPPPRFLENSRNALGE